MSANPHLGQRATISRQKKLSPIWIVPIIALLIGLWLIYDNISKAGTQITLTLSNAEGIEAGKTKIKVLSVDVGVVEQIKLSEDLSHLQVLARIQPEAQALLVTDTQFWVVKPRIGLGGISGLNTVLSGAFIQLQPGKSRQAQEQFEVLDQPPISPNGALGLHVNLVGKIANALHVGDPVSYQGLRVGRVVSTRFDPKQRSMHHELFIEKPYDVLITDNSRFWTTIGIDFKLDAEGFKASIPTVESLVAGGVSFGHLNDQPLGHPVQPDTLFELHPNEETARQQVYDQYLEYVLMVDDSVRGLSNGAPVEFKGIRIGTVMQVAWHYFSKARQAGDYAIPVLIRIEPGRIHDAEQRNLSVWQARMTQMLKRGLHATLKSGNLVTGTLYVDLNLSGHANAVKTFARFEGRTVLPTHASGIAQLEQKLTNLLDKLNQLQIEPVLSGLDQNLQQSAQTLKQSQLTLQEIRNLTVSVQQLLNQPETQQLPAHLTATMQHIQQVLQGIAPDAPMYRSLTQTLQRLDQVLREAQPLVRTLNEQPNAVIFGRKPSDDPIPLAPAATTNEGTP